MLSKLKKLKYIWKQRPLPLEKPIVLQFPINDICNSKCQMCRIWENKDKNSIIPENLRKALKNHLFDEIVSVGVNGGEPTLREDLPDLVEVLFQELPKLEVISLISNGYDYENVILQIDKVAKVVQKYHGKLDIMISLDGVGSVHDRVRGRSDFFKRANLVIDHITKSLLVDNVRIGCTIIKENAYHLHDLLEFCINRGIYIKYRLGIPHQRLYTENLIDPYALSNEQRYEIVEFIENLIKFYENNDNQKFFYRSLIEQILYKKPRRAGCDWKHRGVTISHKGELLYCAVQSPVILEDISNGNSYNAYYLSRNKQLEIIETKCNHCLHDYNGIPDRVDYLHLLISKVVKKIKLKQILKHTNLLPTAKYIKSKYEFNKRRKYYFSYIKDNYDKTVFLKKEHIKVLICGWYGTETLGDKAILGGVIHALQDSLRDDIQFVIVSLFPYITEMTKSQMTELSQSNIVTVEDGIKLVPQMDYVIFGGGPIMGIDNLAEMEAIFTAASKNGVKTVISSCGVGPLGMAWHKKSIKNILKLSDIRIYRDEGSKKYALDLQGGEKSDSAAEDPAFTWLSSILPKISVVKPDLEKKILLLGLRDFPYQDYAQHISVENALQIKDKYEKSIIQILELLCNEHDNLIIKPLPMCTNHFGGDDRWFYRRLFRGQFELNKRINLELLGAEKAPLSYCEEFRKADAILAMRFHSLVFALGLGTPAVALDYTLGKGKVKFLADKFNVPFCSVAEIEPEKIVKLINKQFEQKDRQGISAENLFFTQTLSSSLNNGNSK